MADTYCTFVAKLEADNLHRSYHDFEYGLPVSDDRVLFERLILEINQAGLSWETILKKREGFRRAYRRFDVEAVAKFDQNDIHQMMQDTAIIRNQQKIHAAIFNAQRVLELQDKHGSFLNWLQAHQHLAKDQWVRLFRETFKFMGPEIVGEFLISTGFLPGAHEPSCPIYTKVLVAGPAWAMKQ